MVHVFFLQAGVLTEQLYLALHDTKGRPPGRHALEPHTLSMLEWYRRQGPEALQETETTATRIMATMESFFESVDVTLCPTVPIVPPPLGTLSPTISFEDEALPIGMRVACYTAVHNIAGAPSMSVPLHITAAGLPVGSMFSAAPGADSSSHTSSNAPYRGRSGDRASTDSRLHVYHRTPRTRLSQELGDATDERTVMGSIERTLDEPCERSDTEQRSCSDSA